MFRVRKIVTGFFYCIADFGGKSAVAPCIAPGSIGPRLPFSVGCAVLAALVSRGSFTVGLVCFEFLSSGFVKTPSRGTKSVCCAQTPEAPEQELVRPSSRATFLL